VEIIIFYRAEQQYGLRGKGKTIIWRTDDRYT